MSLKSISPQDAAKLIQEGAVLVDIREADERAREKIPGAHHMALSQLDEADMSVHSGRPVIFHCRSGMRTLANAESLGSKAQGQCEVYVVEGGLEAWKKAGLPVATDRSKPIEIQRQVQIIAGSLGLIGTLLGVFIHPGFLVIPAFIGAGLTFAGATGFCGMALVLARAPWNRTLRNA